MGGIGEGDGRSTGPREQTAGTAPKAQLSEDAVRVFRWVSDQGSCDVRTVGAMLGLPENCAASAVRTLTDLLLLRHVPEDPDRLVPVAPDAAIAALIAPKEAGLRRQLAEIDQLRGELALLTPLYTEGRRRWQGRPALTEVTDLKTVVGMITEATMRCRREVRTCHPGGGRSPALLEQAFVRDRDMLRRGVRMRTLYQHTARYHLPTQEYARRMTAEGAEIRTLSELFGRMVAFDGETVFIPHQDDLDAAIVIHDPSTVAYLCTTFDHAWSLAEPYQPAWTESSARDEVKQAIVRLLAEGMKDEMVARRLGMSLRTCRKHIAEIMEQLGAASRFQAGYLARVQSSGPAATAPGTA
ncbi:LuxR C-terminal-related transcriptional regulator [Streptomyces sp. ATexAB-D23]|uniref:LuxR C-terminal-related transcriptional regulator n=1 Tax=unclassified Streptomyces TaxID=2593676 RepID=UPI0003627302|nr:LuxR C-terminal-related transcriptional regulator [Streptomyces sp. ATexAB-D23]MYY05593.1 LuxR family transcriptional regulator [Streptomyces sp. SID4913]